MQARFHVNDVQGQKENNKGEREPSDNGDLGAADLETILSAK